MGLIIVSVSSLFILMLFLNKNAPEEIICAHIFHLTKFNQASSYQKDESIFLIQIKVGLFCIKELLYFLSSNQILMCFSWFLLINPLHFCRVWNPLQYPRIPKSFVNVPELRLRRNWDINVMKQVLIVPSFYCNQHW